VNILVLDTETTSIEDDFGNPLNPLAVEVAWALYNTEHNEMLACASFLTEHRPDAITERIAGISEKIWNCRPEYSNEWEALIHASRTASAVLAHNAPFDKAVLERSCPYVIELPWVDPLQFSHPKFGHKLRSLNETAASLGVPTGMAHRALADVLTLCAVLKHIPDLDKQITTQTQGLLFEYSVKWDFSHPNFEAIKHVVRKSGFTWEPARKRWVTKIFSSSKSEADVMVGLRLRALAGDMPQITAVEMPKA
jgi:DNA polymerase III epsilon subunit-like protein